MNHGRIDQLGAPSELYERPATPFVASFLGVSNLLGATVEGPELVRLVDGTPVQVPEGALAGHSGRVAIGIRPEKIRPDDSEPNRLSGVVAESAYIGVSTQYIVDTPAGSVSVCVQNDRPGAQPVAVGHRLSLSWNPECTFVVDHTEAPQ
jgi:spermidine/putrescine transport system ATP-binding protein